MSLVFSEVASVEKLTTLAVETQAEHENETTETKARQIQLDRTAEEFHALHAERQQLVRQWQDALEGTRKIAKDLKVELLPQVFSYVWLDFHNNAVAVPDWFASDTFPVLGRGDQFEFPKLSKAFSEVLSFFGHASEKLAFLVIGEPANYYSPAGMDSFPC